MAATMGPELWSARLAAGPDESAGAISRRASCSSPWMARGRSAEPEMRRPPSANPAKEAAGRLGRDQRLQAGQIEARKRDRAVHRVIAFQAHGALAANGGTGKAGLHLRAQG